MGTPRTDRYSSRHNLQAGHLTPPVGQVEWAMGQVEREGQVEWAMGQVLRGRVRLSGPGVGRARCREGGPGRVGQVGREGQV